MFEQIRNTTVASFKLGGEKIELNPAHMVRSANSYSKKIGDLSVVLNFEELAENFYRWCVWITNNGSEKTAQITELYGADIAFPVSGKTVWESIYGDNMTERTFMPRSEELADGGEIIREGEKGRSSQGEAFPYFDVTSALASTVFAVGWTGQFRYQLKREGNSAFLQVGFTDCDMYLNPGEHIRSASILVYTDSDLLKARHGFRRLFREKLSPAAKNGGHMTLPVSYQEFDRYFWKSEESRKAWATEQVQLDIIECTKRVKGIDAYWLDAGWFKGLFPYSGNFTIFEGYPNTLLPLSEASHKLGHRFILWFEPERIFEGTEVDTEHPDFVLRKGCVEEDTFLYDLSKEEAYIWLRDTIIGVLRDNGVDIYRQDFNIDPITYWRCNDAPDRKGYTENKHITNLYRLWDAILAEFPGMIIDNCSSGGRRLDFEMLSRSVPLWRCDSGCFQESPENHYAMWHQNQTIGLSRYLPYHSTCTKGVDSYMFRSAMTMGLSLDLGLREPDLYKDGSADAPMEEFMAIRDLWEGDFYPLTDASYFTFDWVGYQLVKGDEGFCVFFRRGNSPNREHTFHLYAIDPDRDYEVILSDQEYNKTTVIMKGSALQHYEAYLLRRRWTILLRYRAI